MAGKSEVAGGRVTGQLLMSRVPVLAANVTTYRAISRMKLIKVVLSKERNEITGQRYKQYELSE
jgi:hypothetical protein